MNPEVWALLQAMMQQQQQQQQGGMQQELDAANALGPEGQQQLAALGTMPERMGLGREVYGQRADQYAGDIAQGQKLQAGRFGNSGGATGNLLGGLGDVLNTIRGGIMENRAREGREGALGDYRDAQTKMLDTQDKTRGSFANARLQAMRDLFARNQPQAAAPYYLAKP